MLYILYMHIHTHTHSLAVHYLVKSRWPSARLPFEREVTWRPGSSGDASHRPTSCLWPPGGHFVLIRSSKSISCIHTETGFHVNAAWRWYALISPVSSGACDHSFMFLLCAHLCVCDTSRHVFLHLILRVCSCKYNLIWMFMEFIELACGSRS